jgi:hypothetical protein
MLWQHVIISRCEYGAAMASACGGGAAAIERARERKLRRNGIEGHSDTECWCRKFPGQMSASCTHCASMWSGMVSCLP